MGNQNIDNNEENFNEENFNEENLNEEKVIVDTNIFSEINNNESNYSVDVNEDNTENKVAKKSKKKNSVIREVFEWIMVIVAALLISMLIKAFLFSTYQVNMVSMENTLFEGHNVIVYKTGYFFNEPKHGDIIVFMHEEGKFKSLFKYLPIRNPGEVDYIKRVIGLPGDQIDIREDGYVYLKEKGASDFIKLDEPYANGLTDSKGMKLPYTVPEGMLFAMGDNRERSMDSRDIGPIDIDAVIGKAVLRIWPFTEFGGLE